MQIGGGAACHLCRISHHYHIFSYHHHHDPSPPQQVAPKSSLAIGRSWTGDSGSCRWMRVCLTKSASPPSHGSIVRQSPSLALVGADLHSPLSPYFCRLSPASRDFSCRHPRLAHKVMQSIYNPKPHLFYNCKPPAFGIPSIALELRVLMQRRAGFDTSRGSVHSSAMHRIRHIRGHPSSLSHRHRRIRFLSRGVLRNRVLALHSK